jgi:serine phosphatase RsbU (regulator of sigma subunit)
MNRLLYDDLSQVDMFITAQLIFVDTRQRLLTAASAGHCPALLAAADSPGVRPISPEGVPLGVVPTATFADETVPLGPQSRLLLYTDGLTDARNAAGESFGPERLTRWFAQSTVRGQSADLLKAGLTMALTDFQALDPLRDDQTFLILAEQDQPC